jgi:hypothetical protein
MRQGEQTGGQRRAWLGIRASVAFAAFASVLALAMFAAVAAVVYRDSGRLSAPTASGARVAQGHEDVGRNPLQSSEHAATQSPHARIAHAHHAALESPWRRLADDITNAILPGYRIGRRDDALGVTKTRLVEFDSAPFPYDGEVTSSARMAYAAEDGDEIRTSARSRLFRQKNAYSDRRVLLHIPQTFNAKRPGVMVVFFHGHRATLTRDVLQRQQVAAQISAAGVNAVLVAPQFAVAAADSSPGNLGEPGGFKRFLDEAAKKLAGLYGDPSSARVFSSMPVVLVAYSGGYLASAFSLHHGGATARVRGVVLLDALYGEVDKFAAWIAGNREAFFVSAYIRGTTRAKNNELMQLLQERDIPFVTEMPPRNRRDNVVFLASTPGTAKHRDFVTHAWAASPIKDVLQRQAARVIGAGAVARSTSGGAVR